MMEQCDKKMLRFAFQLFDYEPSLRSRQSKCGEGVYFLTKLFISYPKRTQIAILGS